MKFGIFIASRCLLGHRKLKGKGNKIERFLHEEIIISRRISI